MSDDKKLIFEEFLRMPRSEQNIRYKDLSDHDKFRARMSEGGYSLMNIKNDPPMTEEELCDMFKMTKEEFEEFLKAHNIERK